MLAKLADNAIIVVAAILTICGIALVFMPWQALYQHASEAAAPPAVEQQAGPGEIVVGLDKKPSNPAPHGP